MKDLYEELRRNCAELRRLALIYMVTEDGRVVVRSGIPRRPEQPAYQRTNPERR